MKSNWIMVVDDDPVSQLNARNLLEENQMRVSTVSSGQELLAFLTENDPDLILLDILMPEMDGFETYHRLREQEMKLGRRETPVIFLTGENDSTVERRGLTMGASDFVRKPFNRDILLRRIHNTIQNDRTIESLTEEATIDKLTGFLNKASTTGRMTELCRSAAGMLTILDLDSFKLVNDLFGHDMGDRVLRAFADIVRLNTRAGDVLCRIGGDEFLVFCHGATDEQVVSGLAQRLNEQLAARCRDLMGEDFDIPIGVSIGAVPVPEQGGEYEQLFPLADKALYRVKQNGKHGYALYDEALCEENPEEAAEALDRELARMTQIVEERGGGSDNAMWLGQDAFTSVYRYVTRSLRRTGEPAVKILFRLSATDGGNSNSLSEAVERFGDILSKTLSAWDLVLRSRRTRFFVLLPGQSEQSAGDCVERVLAEWREAPCHDSFSVAYVMEELSFRKTGGSAVDPRLKAIPGLSWEAGLDFCGSPDAYRGLLDVFRQAIAKEADKIESFWRGGDLKNYTIKVHALKSSARTIGAQELSERAKELEAAGNAGDTALIGEKTPALLEQYRAFAEKLRPIFDDGGADVRPDIGADKLAEAYSALAECAEMMDYDMAEMALGSLKDYRLPPEDAKRTEDIRAALTDLDWDRIAALSKR